MTQFHTILVLAYIIFGRDDRWRRPVATVDRCDDRRDDRLVYSLGSTGDRSPRVTIQMSTSHSATFNGDMYTVFHKRVFFFIIHLNDDHFT